MTPEDMFDYYLNSDVYIREYNENKYNNKQEDNLFSDRAMKYNKSSALENFSEEEYKEIVFSQVFILTELDRLKALLQDNKITKNELNDEMSYVTQIGREIRDRLDLTNDDMSFYYYFSEHYDSNRHQR